MEQSILEAKLSKKDKKKLAKKRSVGVAGHVTSVQMKAIRKYYKSQGKSVFTDEEVLAAKKKFFNNY